MMVKAVVLFLLVMLVLGMIGKLRLPRLTRRKPGTAIEPARKCAVCGAFAIGGTPCARSDCPTR